MITTTNNLQHPQDGWIRWERIGLFLVIAAAVVTRAMVNFSTDLMPGLMSAYYPIQVRALLETGHLGYPDFPLVFYLEAGLAKLLQILGFCDLNSCVMFSSKFIDAALYPLIAIPIFFLAKTIIAHAKVSKWIPLLAAALVTISGPAFVMMADFQKNSIGLMWSAFYLYFLYKSVKDGGLRNYLLAGAFFILTGLTHIGGLGFIIAFTLSFFFFSAIFQRQKIIILLKILVLLVLISSLVYLGLFFFDPERLKRLTDVFLFPLTMFEHPMIISILKGKVPLSPEIFLDFCLPNLLVVFALILLALKRKEMLWPEKALFLASLLVTVFMASPLLEDELANRLYKMTYPLMAIIFIIILKYISAKWRQLLFASIVLLIMIGSAPLTVIKRGATCITNQAFQDLSKLKTVIANPDKTLILTRHGLEFWTAWVLEVEVGSERSLSEEAVKKYEEIYYLKQKSGQGNFGPFGPGKILFPEVKIPSKTQITYEDEFYILAKALPGFLQDKYKEEKKPDTSTKLINDFMPPIGKAQGPGQGNGPWNQRLMTATSNDSLNFTRTNQVITDQGSVPDLAVDNQGWIYLYYTAWTVNDEQNKTVVAISQDRGSTWTYKKLNLSGFDEKMASAVDPDIQILSDGVFRLYLTSDPHDGQGPRTYYAEGSDGINFEKRTVAFAQPNQMVLDPSTILIGFTWHYFAGGAPGEKNWHATSSDGKTFFYDESKTFLIDNKKYMMANGIVVPGGYRFYVFANQDNSLRSFFTTDGVTWTADPGARLTLDPSTGKESSVLGDPTVVRLSDGTYLMVYVTTIP